MGKASSGKKVARAARVGATARRARTGRSLFWPSCITVIIVLGTLGVVFSRQQKQSAAAPLRPASVDKSAPVLGDHWHAAYGFYVCGKFLSPVSNQVDPVGIHTHGDGVIHVHPFPNAGHPFTGRNATLGTFMRVVDGRVTATEIKVPDGKTYKNGDKCGKTPAEVQVKSWKYDDPNDPGTPVTDPSHLKLFDRELVTVAFMPKDSVIPKPPSAPQLDKLGDVASTTTTAPGAPPTSAAPGDTTPTSAPPDTTATTAPPDTTATTAAPPTTTGGP